MVEPGATPSAATVERIFREEGPKVLATLIRQLREFELAEEVLQDAFAVALERWTSQSLPQQPGAWILTTARRRAVDALRRRRNGHRKTEELQRIEQVERELRASDADQPVSDDSLRLIFTCCHPALSMDARVALTLRSLCGLTTPEIARAYLVPEATMAQRIVRAKSKIRRAGIPYRVPSAEELPERLDGALGVLYLVFNEGYFATSGDSPTRADLCEEAIRLGRHLASLLAEPEVFGLLSLMTLLHARRRARLDRDGVMVPLEDQDRAQWDAQEIATGVAILHEALGRGRAGPYQLQAAIAAVHAEAAASVNTDWKQIVMLYRELARRCPSPVVDLNLAAAMSHLIGAQGALARIDAIAGLDGYQPLHATRAALLRELGRNAEAAAAFERAIALTTNEAVRRFLERQSATNP